LSTGELKGIKIKGFKSIKNCDVAFGKLNLLIGNNGAGKSNFISVFELLKHIDRKQLQNFVATRGVSSLLYNGRKFTEEISLDVLFDKNSYGCTLVPTSDNQLIFKQEYVSFHDNPSNNRMVEKGTFEARLDKDEADISFSQELVEQDWIVYHFHDTGENSRVKQEHNVSNNLAFASDARNLAAFLYRLKNNYRKSYDEIVRMVRMVAPYFDDFILVPKEENREHIVLKWRQIGCDDVFNASQFSDGTLRFICLATLLLQPKELLPVTIIIDEPELGLHPYAISLFAEMVHALPEGHQIIISTQSVELLNEFDVADVIVVDRNDNGSQFKRLDEKELSEWLALDYALGDLWKKNILGGRLSK